MATKCYTDAEIAAIIAAASGGPTLLDTQFLGQQLSQSELDRLSGGELREADNIQPPTNQPALRLFNPNQAVSALSGAGAIRALPRATELQTLLERYPFLDPYYREKYGTPMGGGTVSLPSGPTTPLAPGPVRPESPTTTQTTQAGPPDAIYSPGQPETSNGGNMNGFSCPSPSVGTCFSDIPRADVSEVLTFPFVQGESEVTQTVDLDNVRGMNLCSISGILSASIPLSPQIYQTLFFYGTYSLFFRGQSVPGWTERPLSEILADPGCCDPEEAIVNCLIPEHGALEIRIDFGDVTLGPDVVATIATRLRFSGCECAPSGCGCGCGGGHPRRITYSGNGAGDNTDTP